jgi:hypothetical protein
VQATDKISSPHEHLARSVDVEENCLTSDECPDENGGGSPSCCIMKFSDSSSCSRGRSNVCGISTLLVPVTLSARKKRPIKLSCGHCAKNDLWESPFILHHLVRIFSTPYTHIMSVHFPADMKPRLITKHNTIKKTVLHH